MFIYNFIKISIESWKYLVYIICLRFNDATPVDRSKVAVQTIGIEMRKIAFFNLLLFNFISWRCQNTKLRKVIADINNEITAD